jgi:hypothetical protein
MKGMEQPENLRRKTRVQTAVNENLAEADASLRPELRLEFRQAPLRNVLRYLSDAAGVVINAQPNVPLHGEVDLWRDEPVDSQEAISLLRRSLGKQDCTVLQRGRFLKIIKRKDLKKCRIPLPSLADSRQATRCD